MPQQITFTCPDDWHLHVRDGAPLRTVVSHSAALFARALVKKNRRLVRSFFDAPSGAYISDC